MERTEVLEALHSHTWQARLSILLATDGSEHALKGARFVAGMLSPGQAEVRLLTVVSIDLAQGELMDADARADRIQAEAEKAFGESRRILQDAGQATLTGTRTGYPPDEILGAIADWEPDLVVVGRRGLNRLVGLVLGSVSNSLLRHSKVPVLVVP